VLKGTATAIDERALKRKKYENNDLQCSKAKEINHISEIIDSGFPSIGSVTYEGLVVMEDIDDDQETDYMVGHLTMSTSSMAKVSIDFLQDKVVISVGGSTLILSDAIEEFFEIDGKPIEAEAFFGILYTADMGILTGSLNDIAKAFHGLAFWVNDHIDGIPGADGAVSIQTCSLWRRLALNARMFISCTRGKIGVELMNLVACFQLGYGKPFCASLISPNYSDDCEQAFSSAYDSGCFS
jgi:hypothetical protein